MPLIAIYKLSFFFFSSPKRIWWCQRRRAFRCRYFNSDIFFLFSLLLITTRRTSRTDGFSHTREVSILISDRRIWRRRTGNRNAVPSGILLCVKGNKSPLQIKQLSTQRGVVSVCFLFFSFFFIQKGYTVLIIMISFGKRQGLSRTAPLYHRIVSTCLCWPFYMLPVSRWVFCNVLLSF